MHQGAEGYAILPAGGKVLDLHPLFQSKIGVKHEEPGAQMQEPAKAGGSAQTPMSVRDLGSRKLTGNTTVFQ